jgi:hypothetical protein
VIFAILQEFLLVKKTKIDKSLILLVGPAGLEPATRPL